MKYVQPFRAKVLMIVFFTTGTIGMVIGIVYAPPTATLIFTFMGVINFGLGLFFGYILMTQTKKDPDKRKKKKKDR